MPHTATATPAPTGLLDARDYYKPFQYPWAFRYYEMMFHDLHWGPHEAPMMDDIKDWNFKLTPAEKEFLTQLFRFFTQADVDIARAYYEKYIPRFPHPELRMMLGAFATAEANHIHSYATLIETLGMPESEFRAFQSFKAMKDKHEYMFERESGKSISDLAVDIAVFSAFGEGMQLFSSFALLMNFQRRGLMKGMTTIVEWSIRDESLHVEAMVKLFHTLIEEHPRVWNDDTKQRVYEACRQMVKLEDKFIEQAFSFGPIDGVTISEAKQYIRYIADRRLLQLGLKPNYRVKDNPFPWLDWIMNAPTHTNFFEQRSTEYGKGEIKGWDTAFDFIDKKDGCEESVCELGAGASRQDAPQERGELWANPASTVFAPSREAFWKRIPTTVPGSIDRDPVYRVYTMPGCPYCDQAKDLLNARDIPYDFLLIEDAEERKMMKAAEGDWKTFPMIYLLGGPGEGDRFLGGASALSNHLAQG